MPIRDITEDSRISPDTELLLYTRTGGTALIHARAFFTNRGKGFFKADSLVLDYTHYALISKPRT